MSSTTRTVRVFRYDPTVGGDGNFQTYTLEFPNESAATMLDVLLRIQREQDPSIAFRFACRVAMCGSCGMVINGRERLACKTNVADIPAGEEITLRPMNHFPVIKDLVVDMQPLFERFDKTLAFFEPKDDSTEPARISPDAPERDEIRLATDCIACGCCVSSCTMAHHHEEFAGPAAMARAYAFVADKRDGLHEPRLAIALASSYACRTETNCTAVCPKGISPTYAIKYIQRVALTHHGAELDERVAAAEDGEAAALDDHDDLKVDRATFLRQAGVALVGGAIAASLGGIAAITAIGPTQGPSAERWIPVAKLSELPAGQITTLLLNYEARSGIYSEVVSKPVLISRLGDEIVCYKTACPHLGCTVRWDGPAEQFRCACHGGTFDKSGNVVAGPPPRGLDRYQSKVESNQLLVML
jgi:succinate dehydrogenase / fumarate reductase iron-sulfur subunit